MRINTRTLETEIARQELTYRQVASAARITEKTLQQARNGEKIRARTAGRIAAALHIDVEKILQG